MRIFDGFTVVGEPRRWKNITVWGLRADAGREIDHGIASHNFQRGKLTILETGEVGEIELKSTSSRPTLIPEGTRLIGGRQDRVINSSVFIPANATVRVKVSCVEQNRWRARNGVDVNKFSIADFLAGPGQRTVLKGTTSTGHVADQRSVWESVSDTVTSLGAGVGSGTLSQAYEAVESDNVVALQALSFVPGANGIAIAIGSKIRTVEFFNNEGRLKRSWAGILGSHIVETHLATGESTVDSQQLNETLAAFGSASWQSVQSASIGQETRTSIGDSRASIIQLGDSLIHASVVFA